MAGQGDLSTCIQATCIQITVSFHLVRVVSLEKKEKQQPHTKNQEPVTKTFSEQKQVRVGMKPSKTREDIPRALSGKLCADQISSVHHIAYPSG